MVEILDWLPALVAILASIAGILVGVDQLTTGARLRKKATFWEEQLASPKLPYDTEVMRSLQREATARLAALEGYPGSKVLTAFYAILLSPFVAGFCANGLASLHQENRFDLERILSYLIFFVLAVLAFPGGIVALASTMAGRRILVRRYLEGQGLSHDLPGAGIRGSMRSPGFGQQLVFSLTVNVAAAIVGVSLVYPGLPEAYSSSSVWIRAPLGTIAFFLVTFGLRGVDQMFKGDNHVWQHPRAAPAAHPAGRTPAEKEHPLA